MNRRLMVAAGALTIALVAAACGSSSKPTGGRATGSPTVPSAGSAPGASQAGAAPSATFPLNSNAAEVNPPGDIPDDQVFVAYSPPAGIFTVSVPEGWARTESVGAVTFTDKLNSIRMETIQPATQPTVESARTVDIPAIQAAAKSYQPGEVSSVTRKSGPAILITYLADSAPDPVTGKVIHDDVQRYEFFKGGKEVVLTLSGPKDADNVDPWRIVTDSFVWK